MIGDPISHSLSPKIHRYWYECYDIKADYSKYQVNQANLSKWMAYFRDNQFKGFNVTVPLKEVIIPYLDQLDPFAKSIGAVNTVIFKDKKTIGFNTDAPGYLKNISQEMSETAMKNMKNCYMIGSGGASKAILSALLTLDINRIYITNRTFSKAKSLEAIDPRIKVIDWEEKETVLDHIDLLINTTSLGMNGINPLELNIDPLPKSTIVSDIVYKPLWTPLLLEAQQKNCKVINGIGMLIYQAALAFEKLWGILPKLNAKEIKYLEKIIL